MDHKQTAERIVLPIICAFAAGVLLALHVAEGETDQLRAQVEQQAAAEVACQNGEYVAAHQLAQVQQ